MVRINFLPTEFNEVKQSIIESFKNNPKSFFKDYFSNYTEGSMLSNVVDLFAYITTYFNYMISVSANEPFIPFAQIDKNVYAAARSLGYNPHRRVASRCMVQFDFKFDFIIKFDPNKSEEINIPSFTTFKSLQGKWFTLMETVTFKFDNETSKWRAYKKEDGVEWFNCTKDELDVLDGNKYKPLFFLLKQGRYEGRVYRPTSHPNQQIYIDRNDIDDAFDSILIISIKNNVRWNELTNLLDFDLFDTNLNSTYDNLNKLSTSPIWINGITDKGVRISFGDGKLGKIPEEDDLLTLRYFVTDGESGNNNKGFVTSSKFTYVKSDNSNSEFGGSNLILTIDSENFPNGSNGGAEKQTVDSVRNIAPLTFSAQDRIVVDKDYDTFIRKQNFVNVQDVKVISGEKHQPPIMGGVAIVTAKQTPTTISSLSDLFLSIEEKDTLKHYLQSKCVVGSDNIKFIDPEIIHVLLTGKVFYNPLLYSLMDTQNAFNGIVEGYFNDLSKFSSYFKYSQLIGYFTSSREIDHTNLIHTLFLTKKCNRESLEDDILINLNNSIVPGSITTNFRNSYLNNNKPYTLIIEEPDDSVIDSDRIDYYYSLYDDGKGLIFLKEDSINRNSENILSTVEFEIGTINYNTGLITLRFNEYDFMIRTTEFQLLNRYNGDGKPYFQSLLDILTINGDFILKFSFKTKLTDSFKASGTHIIRYLNPVVEFIAEK